MHCARHQAPEAPKNGRYLRKPAGMNRITRRLLSERCSPWLHVALLCLVGAWFFLPLLGSVHLFDWDEANFAEASREMIQTGEYFRVQINYEPFWEKPPLFFWLQSASMHLFGINEFAARFVNALCGIVTLGIVYLIGRRLYDYSFGLLWALSFLGSFLPHFFFRSGVIDPVFNLFIFLGIHFLARATEPSEEASGSTRPYVWAGIAVGAAVLTKGPVAFLVTGLCIAVVWALRRFRPVFSRKGLILFCTAVAAVSFLFYGVETIRHGTWFIEEFLKYHLRLLRTGDAGHGRPFYFHPLVLLFGCFPASFFALRGLGRRVSRDPVKDHYTDWMVVLFWVVLILFSLVKTKTVLYSSLTYFPITYLAAWHIHGVIHRRLVWGWKLNLAVGAFGLLCALAIALFPPALMFEEAIAPLIQDKFALACLERPVPWSGLEILVGLGYGMALAAGVWAMGRGGFARGTTVVLAASALCVQLFMIVFAPKMEHYIQRGPIEFYKSFAGRDDAYMRPLFKSYAYLFYSRAGPPMPPESRNKEWLLTGPIDKPAYFVSKSTRRRKYLRKYNLEELRTEYGFSYFRRDPPAGADSVSSD